MYPSFCIRCVPFHLFFRLLCRLVWIFLSLSSQWIGNNFYGSIFLFNDRFAMALIFFRFASMIYVYECTMYMHSGTRLGTLTMMKYCLWLMEMQIESKHWFESPSGSIQKRKKDSQAGSSPSLPPDVRLCDGRWEVEYGFTARIMQNVLKVKISTIDDDFETLFFSAQIHTHKLTPIRIVCRSTSLFSSHLATDASHHWSTTTNGQKIFFCCQMNEGWKRNRSKCSELKKWKIAETDGKFVAIKLILM